MKKRKQSEMLLTVLELAALAGILIVSFYLLYGYLQEGEQAVNGTDVRLKKEETPQTEDGTDTSESAKEETSENGNTLFDTVETDQIDIRVRILDNSYADDLFDEIAVSCAESFVVEQGILAEDGTFESISGDELYEADQTYTAVAEELALQTVLRLSSTQGSALSVTSLTRADGPPEYEGELYIYRLDNGLALVNVLPLEEYLCAVVSSEMPSYYPEEALKAQAVCARTYAFECIGKRLSSKNTNEDVAADAYLDEKNLADLNDSASFQVYNNRKSTEASVNAVEATRGKVLLTEDVRYYSTSVLSEHRDDLDEEDAFRAFLEEEPEEGAEYDSPWLRWQVQIPAAQILENLKELYPGQYGKLIPDGGISTDTEISFEVVSRSGNGQVQMLDVKVGEDVIEIEGEYAIRQALAPNDMEVTLRDGSAVSGMQLLPSAFFYLEMGKTTEKEPDTEKTSILEKENPTDTGTISIYGGGYGHGSGMSQYGAAQMAADGAACLDILEYYFGNNG